MKQFSKWLALLMAGLLLSAALLSCDDGYDWSEEEDGDDDEEQSESSSQYKNLTPEELWDAILDADEFTFEMVAIRKNGDDAATSTCTVFKDGDLLKCEIVTKYGEETSTQTAYFDLKNNLDYEEEDGQWYYSEGKDEEADLSDLLDDVCPVDLLFDKDCYEAESENSEYIMLPDAIREELNAPGEVECEGKMTSKGSVYTFIFSASDEAHAIEYTITVKFKSDTIKLPDAKPAENEGEAFPDIDEH